MISCEVALHLLAVVVARAEGVVGGRGWNGAERNGTERTVYLGTEVARNGKTGPAAALLNLARDSAFDGRQGPEESNNQTTKQPDNVTSMTSISSFHMLPSTSTGGFLLFLTVK